MAAISDTRENNSIRKPLGRKEFRFFEFHIILKGEYTPMNAERRKRIRSVIYTPPKCTDTVSDILDEEEDAMNNMPENLQDSDRYTAMEDAVTYLEDAGAALDEAIQNLKSTTS